MNEDDALLHSKKFHERVTHIVNENEYLRDIIKNLQIDSKIRESIKYECVQLGSHVNNLKTDALNSIIRDLPSQVAHQITLQMPSYLSQNAEMQKILKTHSDELEIELENKARDILKSIVEDPQYHAVNKVYFESLDKKSEREFNLMRTNQSELYGELKEKIDKKLSCVTEIQNDSKSLHDEIDSLSYYLKISYGIIGVLGAFSAYSHFSK